jgi:long-chain fatty acid transport protein
MRAAALGLAMLVALMPCAESAWAGGIWLYEMATPDQGTAVAGRAALGLDASTAWANPAGMTRLDQSQLLLGAGAVVVQSEFNTQAGTTESGGGANLTTALPTGSGYYVQNVTSDFKLGLALTTLPGLAADYGETWAGRYFLEKAALFGVSISPVAAYRIAPWPSVGPARRSVTRSSPRIRPSTTSRSGCPMGPSRSGAAVGASAVWSAS